MRRRLFLCVLPALLLGACSRHELTPEQQVRERIEEGRQLAEQRDAGGLAELLSADFHGPDAITRRDMRALLTRLFFRYRSPHFLVRIQELHSLPDGRIRARLLIAMASAPLALDKLAEIHARLMALELRFRRDGDAWRVVQGKWRNASLADFLH